MCSLDSDRYPGEHTRSWSQEIGPGPKSSTAQVGLRASFPHVSVCWAGESCSVFAKPSQVEGISQLQPASTMRLNHNIPKSLYIYMVPLTAAFIQALSIPTIFYLFLLCQPSHCAHPLYSSAMISDLSYYFQSQELLQ